MIINMFKIKEEALLKHHVVVTNTNIFGGARVTMIFISHFFYVFFFLSYPSLIIVYL